MCVYALKRYAYNSLIIKYHDSTIYIGNYVQIQPRNITNKTASWSREKGYQYRAAAFDVLLGEPDVKLSENKIYTQYKYILPT